MGELSKGTVIGDATMHINKDINNMNKDMNNMNFAKT